MPMSEREAHEFVRPLEDLPAIEARRTGKRQRRRRHPVRLAVVIGAIGILGTGSAVAAIEKLSGAGEAKREQGDHHRLKGISEASDQELDREVQEHSGGSISPGEVDTEAIRRSARRQLEVQFPDELRFYDAQHRLVHVTKCSWPHPNPDCANPIGAIKNHPGAKGVETWSNGKPIAGGA
jgi:hypothetical protein